MSNCKNCQSVKVVKNGIVRKAQRYRCKDCGYNFIAGDRRSNRDTEVKKALSVILYSLGKVSFGFLGKLFGVARSTTYKWIRVTAEVTPEPDIANSIKEISFDEMWHFVQSKKTKSGSSKPWIVAQGELLPGLSAIVMLQPSNGFTIK